ncbi:hypothetical protein Tco_0346229, partial [Tanacetum coccineum]
GRAGRARGIPLTVEAVPSVGTVPESETASVASKNHTTMLIPLMGPEPSIKRWRESESPPSRGSESSTSNKRHWKSKAKRYKPADEEDLAIPWTCEDVDPFTPRIRKFKSSRKTRMPNNVKTYDETGRDPENHLKIFQAAAQVERWAMPT